MSISEWVIAIGYFAIALLLTPSAMAVSRDLKRGTVDYRPMTPMYADFVAALGVGFWPVFIIIGLLIKHTKKG